MIDQNEPNTRKRQLREMAHNAQTRAIWIGIAVIVLFLLLYTGLRLTHTDSNLMSSPTVEGR